MGRRDLCVRQPCRHGARRRCRVARRPWRRGSRAAARGRALPPRRLLTAGIVSPSTLRADGIPVHLVPARHLAYSSVFRPRRRLGGPSGEGGMGKGKVARSRCWMMLACCMVTFAAVAQEAPAPSASIAPPPVASIPFARAHASAPRVASAPDAWGGERTGHEPTLSDRV